MFIDAKTLDRVYVCPTSKNVYLSFGDVRELRQIVQDNAAQPLVVNSAAIKMSVVNKIPLDLNQGSRIVLVTVYHDKVAINVAAIHAISRPFGFVNRIAIYKKKSFQALIEFRERADAEQFVKDTDNVDFREQFYLRAQFTQKEELVVSANTQLEHDFTLLERQISAPLPRIQEQPGGQPLEEWRQPSRESLWGSYPDLRVPTSGSRPVSSDKRYAELRPQLQPQHRRSSCSDSQVRHSRQASSNVSSPPEEVTYQGNPGFGRGEAPEPIFGILATNLAPQMGPKQVFNLFSLYGNIERVFLNPAEQSAVVVYSGENEQGTALHLLHGLPVFERHLDLHPLAYFPPELSGPGWSSTAYKRSEHFSADKYADRVKAITKPHNTLYVFNLTKAADLSLIHELFAQRRSVVHIEYLNDSKNSCLVYFESVEAAATCLATFKNISVLDKSLKINFADETKVQAKRKHPSRRNLGASLPARVIRPTPWQSAPKRSESDEEDVEGEDRDVVRVDPESKGRAVNPNSGKRRFSRFSTASGDHLEAP